MVYRHTVEGRQKLNFSEWDRPQREADEATKSVRKGEMPPASYGIIHPEARLTAAEKDALIRGLQATFGDKLNGSDWQDGDHDDD